MAAAHAGADEAVLNMLDQYGVLMLEDLITGRPDFGFAELALAIQRLSRTDIIALCRIGLPYEIRLTNPAWPLGLAPSIKSRLRHNDNKPDVFDRVFGVEGTGSTSPNRSGHKGEDPQ